MIDSLFSTLASTVEVAVPDGGITGWLFGGSLVGLFALARLIKRKFK